MKSKAYAIAHKLYMCAIETPNNDGSPRTHADLVQDGGKAFDQWEQESAHAGDTRTQEDLASVDRADFAREWEELVHS